MFPKNTTSVISKKYKKMRHTVFPVCSSLSLYLSSCYFIFYIAFLNEENSLISLHNSIELTSVLFFFIVEKSVKQKSQGIVTVRNFFVEARGKDVSHILEKGKHHVKFEPTEPKKIVGNDPVFGVVHFTCPQSFTLIDKKCVQTQVAAPLVSCPYGSHRDEDSNCVSVDSVPVERACPPGFQSYDKGCMKRHLLDAVATCPLGYHKSEAENSLQCKALKVDKPQLICHEGVLEGSDCVAKKFSEAKPKCPNGYKMNKGKCFRWLKFPPSYSCPEGYTLSTLPQSEKKVCSKIKETRAASVCEENFVLEGEVCVKSQFFKKKPKCKVGFTLSADAKYCTRITSNALPYCKEGWKYDSVTKKCTKVLYEDPLIVCQDLMSQNYPKLLHSSEAGEFVGIDGCLTVDRHDPVFVCDKGEPVDSSSFWKASGSGMSAAIIADFFSRNETFFSDEQFRRLTHVDTFPSEDMNMEPPRVESNMQCLERLVKAPDYEAGCPPGNSIGVSVNVHGEIMCLQVDNVEPEISCEEGATKHKIERSVDKNLRESTLKSTPSEEGKLFQPSSLLNLKEESADYVCTKLELADLVFVCEDGATPSQGFTTCKESRVYKPENLCPQGMQFDIKNNLCFMEHIQDLVYDCPAGYVMHGSTTKQGEKPQKLKHVMPPSSNSMPFVEYQTALKRSTKKYETKLKKADEEIYHTGVCERVEYATVQVVCPVGYQMQSKKEKGKGCIAEKAVPHSKICEPGFFMQEGKCVKHVEIAPSLINLEGNPIACKIRENGGLSCGHSYQYHSLIKENKLGNGYTDMLL